MQRRLCRVSSVPDLIVTVDKQMKASTRSDKSLGRLERGEGNSAAVYPGLRRLNQVYYRP